jgi:hypothetical protein
MTKLTYKEGDVFAVPLGEGGYGVGVVARVGRRGRIVLGYFFGRFFRALPSRAEMPSLLPEEAILIVRFGDLHLIDGRWPIISQIREWHRETWPMPKFVRIEPVSNRVWLVSYSDNDPGQRILEKEIENNASNYQRDSLKGAGGLEITLAKMLTRPSEL